MPSWTSRCILRHRPGLSSTKAQLSACNLSWRSFSAVHSQSLSHCRSLARALSLSLSLSSIAGIQALEIANAGKFLRKVSGCANGFIICYFLVCFFFSPPSFLSFPHPLVSDFLLGKETDRQTDRHEKGLAKNSWIPFLRIFDSHFAVASWTVSSPGENSCIGVIIVVFSDRTIDGLLAFAGAAFGNRASFVNITQFLGKIFFGFFSPCNSRSYVGADLTAVNRF